MRTIIVDDEPLALEGLRIRLASIPYVKIIGTANSADLALKMISYNNPDLVILDIEMPGLKSGVDIARALDPSHTKVIFLTAHKHFSIDAFDLGVVDFLIKPVNQIRLEKAIKRAKVRIELENNQRCCTAKVNNNINIVTEERYPKLIVKNPRKDTILVELHCIQYISSDGDYVSIHTMDQHFKLRSTLKYLEATLRAYDFLRIHRNSIVNMNSIQRIKPRINSECSLVMANKEEIRVSRKYRDKLNEYLNSRCLIK